MKAIVYHSKDLDGLCSGFIAKKFCIDNGFEFRMFPWDYNDPVPDLSSFDSIIMLDVSFPYSKMEAIKHRLCWIDHHKTAIIENDTMIEGQRFIGHSASKIAWDYFFQSEAPELVYYIDRYDVWKKIYDGIAVWEDVLIRQFDMRLNLLDPGDPNNYLSWCKQLEDFTLSRPEAYLTTENTNKVASKRAFENEFEGLKFCCLNHEGNSESVKSLDSINYYDAIMLFKYDGIKKLWIVSMYGNNKNIDLSLIAKKWGGGGHKEACGFSVKDITSVIR